MNTARYWHECEDETTPYHTIFALNEEDMRAFAGNLTDIKDIDVWREDDRSEGRQSFKKSFKIKKL